jgi:hypothetical protein
MPKSVMGGRRRSHTHSRKCSHRRRKYQKKRKTSRRSYYGGDLAPLSPHSFSGGGSPPSLSPGAFPGGGSQMGGSPLRPLSPLNYSQMGGSGGDGKSTMMPHGVETSSIGNTDSSPAMVGGSSQRGGFLGPALVPFGLLGAQKLYQNSRGTQRRMKRFPGSVKRSLNRYF